MPGRSLFRIPESRLFARLARALPYFSVLLAGLLLGRLVMAWWNFPMSAAWVLPQADPQYAAGRVAQQHWFGALTEHAVDATSLSVKVLGVWAPLADAAAGVAVLEDNGKHLAEPVGKTLPSGWVLAQVQASGVVLRQAGVERFVPLNRPAPTLNGAPAAAPAVPDFSPSAPAPQAAGTASK